MKKKYWFLFAIIIFLICDGIMICYWRDNTNIELSVSTIISMLIGLPLAIICGFYFFIQLIKGIKNKVANAKNSSIEEKTEDDMQPTKTNDVTAPKIHLFILETALVTSFGNNIKSILAGLENKKICEPDSILTHQKSYPYLTRRVESLSQNSILKLEVTALITDRAKRMEQITAQLLQQLGMVLQSIPLKKTYTDHIVSEHQVRLHPEWRSSTHSKKVEESNQVYRPSPSLRIFYILPKHIKKEEQDALLNILKKRLSLFDITEEYDLTLDCVGVENNEDTQRAVEGILKQHLDLNHAHKPQFLLLMGVDSWIDQALLDEKFNIEARMVEPSEAGFAVLFSDQNRTTDIAPIACVTPPRMYSYLPENLNDTVHKVQQDYQSDTLLEEDEILVADHGATHTQALIELNRVANYFQIDRKQTLSLGPLLNDTNAIILGCSFIFAIKNTIHTNKKTMLVHNAGKDFGTHWMVMPFVASHYDFKNDGV